MRRTTPIAHVLYAHLFPSPTPKDPTSFSHHLARDLVPEVRIEVATFYGDLNSTESRYPGLNYCYGPHRMRLGRFKHHARLFAAFDTLRLTDQEILDFCCWEGTLWARERYERDEGVKVPDTTGDNIPQYVDRRLRRKLREESEREGTITRKTDIEVIVEEPNSTLSPVHAHVDEDDDEEMSDDEDDDTASQHTASPPPAQQTDPLAQVLPQSLRTATTSPAARILTLWEAGRQLPPDLEQYLKEQIERPGGSGWNGRGVDLRALAALEMAGSTRQLEQNVASAVGGSRAAAAQEEAF